ncbi:MAG: hypothetical protein MJE68_00420, partial [Proteobacteria bacterium]|nr:hypothetical protein [Pseudomonadota bacterium]
APKSVDIPKLISHVVHINTTKHNPNRGFEFTTSTRDNYPVYLMENDQERNDCSVFKEHLFDRKTIKKKKISNCWFTLSKPKQVCKGGKGVRQYFKIDETKLSLEERYGKQISIETFDI